ncbi:MAG: ABC transporter substrate-binding protein [Anaerolineae bacterium]
MYKKLNYLIAVLAAIFILTACQSAPDEVVSPSGDEEEIASVSEPAEEAESVPTVEPTEAPTETAEPTATEEPTATPEPTATAEPTETPEPTPTLEPTAVPAGVYVREEDGFTFYYPPSWVVLNEEAGALQLQDPALGIFMSVNSNYKDDETTFETYKEEFESEDVLELWGMDAAELLSEEDVPFADGLTAQTATYLLTNVDGLGIDMWLAYAESETREFFIFSLAAPGILEVVQSDFVQMVADAEIGAIRLYGLDRENTFVTLGGDPFARSLDPARTEGSAAGTVGMLYSGLVRMSPELRVEPDLAETWAISPDGTTYTFTLREGLTFASGKPLTAADIKANWERAADPDTDSTTFSTYLGDIDGAQAVIDGEAEELSGVVVIDEQTLEVTLDGPKPYFLAKLTYPVSFVVNLDTVDPDDEEWVYEPDPSGPFLLTEYREGEAMVFASNAAYHTPPALQGIVELIGRVGSGLSLYQAGEIDITGLGATDAQDISQPSHELHDQWLTTTSMCTSLMQLNNENAPFDDVNVRRAFALAVDKEGLNDILSEGTNLIAGSVFPPAMPGYSAELAAEYGSTFDPDAARQALADSSYAGNLPPIAITTGGFGDSERDDLNAMIEKWREVLGVDVTINFLDPVNYTDLIKEEPVQIVSYGWCADYPDPQNFLDVLYHTDSEFNIARYSNPEVDALLEEARVELDTGRRLSLYQEIEAMLLDDAATITLFHGVADVVVNPRLNGYVLSPMGAPIMHLLSFSEEAE